MSKTYLEKTKKHLKRAERSLDGIAPTPLRQTLDACAVHSLNIIRKFDYERYKIDELYASKWNEYNEVLNDLLSFDKIP